MMRKIAIYVLPLLALSVSACSSSKSKNDMEADDFAMNLDFTTPADLTENGDMAIFPAAPTLGMQIDRMGRAGVNTALSDPFWDNGSTNAAMNHHTKQDAYNAVSDPTMWATTKIDGTNTLISLFEGALGAYDALDGTSDGMATGDGCANQLAFGALSNPQYTTLATVLADDELYVNAAAGTCSIYLGVEANVLGVTNTDCGGRTPNYNTIDITYSGLVAQSLIATTSNGCITGAAHCAISNGIYSDPDTVPATTTTFPFLGTAN